MVRNDDDDQAFADPQNPETSACAGPTNSQIVRVDYNASCSDGYSLCTIKSTASVLSGTVTEEEDFDSTTLLSVRTKTTGMTRNLSGTTVSESHTVTRLYDSIGRPIEINGPLNDATALDKTAISYYSSGGFENGSVYQVTRYVGSSASSIQLVT